MEEQFNIFAMLTAVAFVIAFPTVLIAWFRMIRAKNRKDYLTNDALFVLPILLVFLLAYLGGLFQFPAIVEDPPLQIPSAQAIFSEMPTPQLILLVITACIWLIGGYLFFFLHHRNIQKSWWQNMNPLEQPFKNFNKKEWAILITLVVLTFIVTVAALSFNQHKSQKHNFQIHPTTKLQN